MFPSNTSLSLPGKTQRFIMSSANIDQHHLALSPSNQDNKPRWNNVHFVFCAGWSTRRCGVSIGIENANSPSCALQCGVSVCSSCSWQPLVIREWWSVCLECVKLEAVQKNSIKAFNQRLGSRRQLQVFTPASCDRLETNPKDSLQNQQNLTLQRHNNVWSFTPM